MTRGIGLRPAPSTPQSVCRWNEKWNCIGSTVEEYDRISALAEAGKITEAEALSMCNQICLICSTRQATIAIYSLRKSGSFR